MASCGLVATPSDPVALVAPLKSLADHHEQRHMLGLQARQLATGKFSSRQVLEDFCRELVNSASASA
jgi:hypothetical protein